MKCPSTLPLGSNRKVVMETNAVAEFVRHRKSPSSERFLGLFSQSPPEGVLDGGDLEEHDIFWGGRDFSQPARRDPRSLAGSKGFSLSSGFRRTETFGILAALAEDGKERGLGRRDTPVLSRKASIPAIPKPLAPVEYSQSVPVGKFHQSTPLDVPAGQRRNAAAIDGADDGDSDEEMLPPHEIVARGSARSPWTTFSVLEGKGRTLKGRDLRQVRNAVWRRTGFLD
ncbi:protein S40-7-like [Aristolochia californica]|uniref:protein S40-7-like n=1 Tax=Aristolochia californica TaxID=171875 RepID=UPI0035DEF28E